MANPNRTVWHARNRKMAMVEEKHFGRNWAEANKAAEEYRLTGHYDRVTCTSFKMGPRDPLRGWKEWVVRCYEK
jgi:hypothetical protein